MPTATIDSSIPTRTVRAQLNTITISVATSNRFPPLVVFGVLLLNPAAVVVGCCKLGAGPESHPSAGFKRVNRFRD